MSTLKTNNVQVGQSVTADQNFTLYTPSPPDGTVRLGVGNSGATTSDAAVVTNSGNLLLGTTTNTNNSKLVVAGTIESSSGGIRFPDGTTQTAAAVTVQLRAATFSTPGSGQTWVCPAGVTRVKATVIGGGGGGGAGFSNCGSNGTGGIGGTGGIAVGYYTVVPGTSYSITVGAGGAGSNSGNGSAGTSSSFASFCSATGGGGGSSTASLGSGASGTDGVGTGGTLGNLNVTSGAVGSFYGSAARSRAASSTAAIAYSVGTLLPGAYGSGELGSAGNNASGGVGGAVLIEYIGAS